MKHTLKELGQYGYVSVWLPSGVTCCECGLLFRIAYYEVGEEPRCRDCFVDLRQREAVPSPSA